MLRKDFHQTYMVSVKMLLENFEYVIKHNNEAAQTVTVKQGSKVIALMLPENAAIKLGQEMEKLEDQHKLDQRLNKELKKQVEMLQARLELQSKTNNSNSNNDDFPFN